jgi:hypothetical protein
MNRLQCALFWLAVTFTSSHAHAYCVGADQTLPGYQADYYSVPKEFGRAIYVIEGVVEQETWIGEDGKPKSLSPPYDARDNRPWGLAAPYMGAWYEVQVIRTFKGKPQTRLKLFSENSTARFWLNKGEKYLLFVNEAEFDPPITRAPTIDNCGNSDRVKPGLMRQLDALAGRPHRR